MNKDDKNFDKNAGNMRSEKDSLVTVPLTLGCVAVFLYVGYLFPLIIFGLNYLIILVPILFISIAGIIISFKSKKMRPQYPKIWLGGFLLCIANLLGFIAIFVYTIVRFYLVVLEIV